MFAGIAASLAVRKKDVQKRLENDAETIRLLTERNGINIRIAAALEKMEGGAK